MLYTKQHISLKIISNQIKKKPILQCINPVWWAREGGLGQVRLPCLQSFETPLEKKNPPP